MSITTTLVQAIIISLLDVKLLHTWNSAAAAAKSLQSCLILCNTRDNSPPGSPVSGILQARTLEWVAILAIAYFPRSSQRDPLQPQVSHVTPLFSVLPWLLSLSM